MPKLRRSMVPSSSGYSTKITLHAYISQRFPLIQTSVWSSPTEYTVCCIIYSTWNILKTVSVCPPNHWYSTCIYQYKKREIPQGCDHHQYRRDNLSCAERNYFNKRAGNCMAWERRSTFFHEVVNCWFYIFGGRWLRCEWKHSERVKSKYSEKVPFPVPPSTTYSVWTALGPNASIRDEKSASKILYSHIH